MNLIPLKLSHRRSKPSPSLLLFALLFLLTVSGTARAQLRLPTEPVNLNFEQGSPGGVPSGWGTGLTTAKDDAAANPSYAVTVTTRKARVGRYCACIFSKGKPEAGQFGNLMQSLDATPYRNKRVRFRAFVCLNPARSKGIGGTKLWLHVDRANTSSGILDSVDNRLITSPRWQLCAITANVPADAAQISFGLLLVGEGQAYIDGASFETLDALPAGSIGNNSGARTGRNLRRAAQPFPNADFEQGKPGTAPPGWTVIPVRDEKAYAAKIVAKGAAHGRQCAILYRVPKSKSRAGYGVLMQTFDAGKFRGKKVRVQAAVRLEGATPDDRAQLWMRVDSGSTQGGVQFNSGNRPIKSRAWRYYEIVTTVAPDATQINLGVILLRDGRAFVDDVTISAVDDPPVATNQ